MASVHTVAQGEHLPNIARQYRFVDWNTIYNHPKNEDFRKKRPNPLVLLPGDQIYIPDKIVRVDLCATDKRHVFVLKSVKVLLRLVLKDHESKVIANLPYDILIGDKKYSGATNGAGVLEHEIPVNVTSAKLLLDGITCNLAIGHLDPTVDEGNRVISGIQARLNNLGFGCGAVDGELGPKTQAALKRFQAQVLKRETPDGSPDGATSAALLEHHGC